MRVSDDEEVFTAMPMHGLLGVGARMSPLAPGYLYVSWPATLTTPVFILQADIYYGIWWNGFHSPVSTVITVLVISSSHAHSHSDGGFVV